MRHAPRDDDRAVHIASHLPPPSLLRTSTTTHHRQLAGVEMVGARGLQHLMNVHFSSAALAKATRSRPAMLYFIYNKDVVCVLVAHHFESGEFVMQLPYFPPVQEPKVRRCW